LNGEIENKSKFSEMTKKDKKKWGSKLT
jgi:hypothetical protein